MDGLYWYFTFQSGSIQMGETFTDKIYICHLYIPIWFYSNNAFVYKPIVSAISLHSNLVLFKCNRCNEKFGLVIFTFQSGSIQML